MLPVLPPKYYLDHFRDLLAFLRGHAWDCCEPIHRGFVDDFGTVSESAQCLVVRMLNRKGRIFRPSAFRYAEIENAADAWRELEDRGFVMPLDQVEVAAEEIAAFLGKSDLQTWLASADVRFARGARKVELVEIARDARSRLRAADVPGAKDLKVQARGEELRYLLFLYFGKIQESLSLYTLRDLGIRRVREQRDHYQARFQTLAQARAEYFYADAIDRWSRVTETDLPSWRSPTICEKWPAVFTENAKRLRDQLRETLGAFAEREERWEDAFGFYAEGGAHPLNERRVRTLYRLGRVEEVRHHLQQMIADPEGDEELLFAEDFYARKFEGKRRGFLTEALQGAREIQVPETYLSHPELGVCEFLRARGESAHHVENDLWNTLFALTFWDELLNSQEATFHNPFERAPRELRGRGLYAKFESSFERQLQLFSDPLAARDVLIDRLRRHEGEPQDLLSFHPGQAGMLTEFLDVVAAHGKGEAVAQVLRAIAQDPTGRRSGFPDLFVNSAGGPRFIEVKAEGDAVKPRQLSQLRLLSDAGFDVEILRVRWAPAPDQAYVVVDVETTGTGGPFHRITEIGAVKVVGGQIVDEFQSLVNPGRSIPPFITGLTGITNEMVARAPTFADLAEKFLEFSEGAIFAAHNVRFDYGFIQSEYARLDRSFVRPVFCTRQNARKYFPELPSHGLKNICESLGVELAEHHRALCDARAAAEILRRIQERRWGRDQNISVIDPEISLNK